LQTQVSTGKKIQYASEDPIVAALALKFRTNVSETLQYQKNLKQANSWLEATENGISNSKDILDKIRELCVQGASETYNISNRKDISQAIDELSKQFITESNVSYAGRYVFGGYKTDQEVIFTKDNADKYNITQDFTKDNIEAIKAAAPVTGDQVKQVKEVNRIQLAYANAKNVAITLGAGKIIDFKIPTTVTIDTVPMNIKTALATDNDAYSVGDNDVKYLSDTGEILIGNKALDVFKNSTGYSVNYDKEGFKAGELNPQQYFACGKYQTSIATIKNDKVTLSNVLTQTADINTINVSYTDKSTGPASLSTATVPPITVGTSADGHVLGTNEVRYLQDTGEILFGTNVQQNMQTPSDLNITYSKNAGQPTQTNFSNTSTPSATLETKFQKVDNVIEYEFGVNNKMQVNTEGSAIFTTDLIKDLRDIISTIDGLDIRTEQQIKDDLKTAATTPAEIAEYNALVADPTALAAKVKEIQSGEQKIYKTVMSSRLDKALSKIDTHLNTISTQESDIGSRMNRLELIENRLGEDKVNYTDLMNSNENVDYESAYIEYMSQRTIYDSALKVGSQIMQKTLVDFI
jgi:flagellar hook-associated protein 3 FlgL